MSKIQSKKLIYGEKLFIIYIFNYMTSNFDTK